MAAEIEKRRFNFLSPKRLKGWLFQIITHPFGVSIGLITSLGLGIYIGTSMQIITTQEPLKLLSAIAVGISGAIFALFTAIKNIFDFEIKDRQLEKLESESKAGFNEENANKLIMRIVDRVENSMRLFDPREEGRSKHWRLEKKFLSQEFVKFIGNRIKHIRKNKNNSKVAVIFDAGSTISPILNELGIQASEVEDHWTRHNDISIHTNNLTGVLMLLSHKDFNEKDDRHASLPFECSVLPGDVLSAYAATASVSTLSAIKELRKKEKIYIIAISTGNYIFLDVNKKFIAPIARTGMHPDIKSALATCADEIYYIAPLGKVILAKDESLEQLRDRFNKKMGFSDDAKKPSQCSYKLSFECDTEVCEDPQDWYPKSILVTTTRFPGRFFTPHSSKVNSGALGTFKDHSSIPLKDGPYILSWPYKMLPRIYDEQMEIEIPHDYLRENWKDFFDTGESM